MEIYNYVNKNVRYLFIKSQHEIPLFSDHLPKAISIEYYKE